MTATVDTLGGLHQALAEVYKQILAGREEPLFNRDGEPLYDEAGNPKMRRIPPSAAELAAINTFLKANNITAVVGNEGKLAELQRLMEQRRAGRAQPVSKPPDLPDPYAVAPNPNTPWQ